MQCRAGLFVGKQVWHWVDQGDRSLIKLTTASKTCHHWLQPCAQAFNVTIFSVNDYIVSFAPECCVYIVYCYWLQCLHMEGGVVCPCDATRCEAVGTARGGVDWSIFSVILILTVWHVCFDDALDQCIGTGTTVQEVFVEGIACGRPGREELQKAMVRECVGPTEIFVSWFIGVTYYAAVRRSSFMRCKTWLGIFSSPNGVFWKITIVILLHI